MDINFITPRIAIGSQPQASWIPAMQRAGITDVLDLRGEPSQNEQPMGALYAGTGIRYFYLPMHDDGRPQPAEVYNRGVQIITTVLAVPGRKILVHCAAGQYRSPSMVYAYLRTIGLSPAQAWSKIVSHRSAARDQYVSSAEASLRSYRPYVAVGGLLAIGTIVGYALYASRSA